MLHIRTRSPRNSVTIKHMRIQCVPGALSSPSSAPGNEASELCAYQCYAPLPPIRAIVESGDLINLHINCPNIRDIPYNQIPLRRVGDYWGFDTHSVTVQYTKTIATFKMSSEVIKCPTIGAASFGQSPYIACYLPVRGVVGHNIDRCIIH